MSTGFGRPRQFCGDRTRRRSVDRLQFDAGGDEALRAKEIALVVVDEEGTLVVGDGLAVLEGEPNSIAAVGGAGGLSVLAGRGDKLEYVLGGLVGLEDEIAGQSVGDADDAGGLVVLEVGRPRRSVRRRAACRRPPRGGRGVPRPARRTRSAPPAVRGPRRPRPSRYCVRRVRSVHAAFGAQIFAFRGYQADARQAGSTARRVGNP